MLDGLPAHVCRRGPEITISCSQETRAWVHMLTSPQTPFILDWPSCLWMNSLLHDLFSRCDALNKPSSPFSALITLCCSACSWLYQWSLGLCLRNYDIMALMWCDTTVSCRWVQGPQCLFWGGSGQLSTSLLLACRVVHVIISTFDDLMIVFIVINCFSRFLRQFIRTIRTIFIIFLVTLVQSIVERECAVCSRKLQTQRSICTP